jgi:lipid II:glycine glycyltransferase (peptidoglycan interpeptide bridge formation enzyme)
MFFLPSSLFLLSSRLMLATQSVDGLAWDSFLSSQRFRPFLQSWTMGEVYGEIGQKPIRIAVEDSGAIQAICFAHVVDARRGRHLSVPYGPVAKHQESSTKNEELLTLIIEELKKVAETEKCSFIRLSPFWPSQFSILNSQFSISSPLHLLAEHIWYLPLSIANPWEATQPLATSHKPLAEPDLLSAMRKTTRNLIRRAERDGVEIIASTDPMKDVETFIRLHDETRKRHGFTPYTNRFFRAQVKHFAERKECTVYLAKHQGEILAASIHMHAFGETSYHHGASVQSKVPASYLLQWRAIQDALRRGDHIYNFWGIAPMSEKREVESDKQHSENNTARLPLTSSRTIHPFAGVTLFKTGFGGQLLPLVHCTDIPLTYGYWLTRAFETMRKWRRGF